MRPRSSRPSGTSRLAGLSLTTKAFLAAAGAFLILFTTAYFLARSIVMRGFYSLETRQVVKDVERARNSLAAEITALANVTREWATWDDMYAFVETADPAFEKANLTENNYTQTRSTAILIVNTTGRVVYGRGFNQETKSFETLDPALVEYLRQNPKLTSTAEGHSASGIILLKGRPIVFAAKPIVKGSGSGTPRGVVVLTRHLESAEIKHLAEDTRLQLDIDPANESAAALSTDPGVTITGPDTVRGAVLVPDYSGAPGVVITVSEPREIVATGRAAVSLAGFALAGFGILMGIAGWLVHRRISRYLNTVIARLLETAHKVQCAAEDLSGGSAQVAEGSVQQSAAIERTAVAVSGAVELGRANNLQLQESDSRMVAAGEAMKRADEFIDSLREKIASVRSQAERMHRVVKTIDDIAFQTNILSLNAAIEAARAGMVGAGFAVVADEVRKLAQSSSQAAAETGALIEASVCEIASSVDAAVKAQEAFASARDERQRAEVLLSEIARAVREQVTQLEHIGQSTSEVESVTHRNSAAAEQTSAGAMSLNSEARQINVVAAELAEIFG